MALGYLLDLCALMDGIPMTVAKEHLSGSKNNFGESII